MRRSIIVSGVLGVGLLAGCGQGATNAYAPPPPPEVTVARAVRATVDETIESTGSTRAAERVEIRARVGGILAARHVKPGARVEKGEHLFTIDPRPFQAAVDRARATLTAREITLKLAELEVGRVEELVRTRTGTQRELDQRLSAREGAKADIDLAAAELRMAELDLEWSVVRAPIRGRLSAPLPDPGGLVSKDMTLLATIVNDEKVFATYTLDERTLMTQRRRNEGKRPGEDGRPELRILLGLIDDEGYPFEGRYDHADNQVDPATGTILIEALFDNPTGMIQAGQYVRLQAILGQREALLLPETAVLQDPRGRFVLVVGEDGVVQRKDVKAGKQVGRRRVVESGLPDEAWVVVDGLQRARPGTKVVARPQAPAADAAPVGTR